jgi:hypothetical protein
MFLKRCTQDTAAIVNLPRKLLFFISLSMLDFISHLYSYHISYIDSSHNGLHSSLVIKVFFF